jgi:hypothetical protein
MPPFLIYRLHLNTIIANFLNDPARFITIVNVYKNGYWRVLPLYHSSASFYPLNLPKKLTDLIACLQSRSNLSRQGLNIR